MAKDPLCQPCKEAGRKQLAHRIVDGVPKCERCWKGIPYPQDSQMKRIEPEKQQEIAADAAAGMPINAIAKKHGISWDSAKTYAGAGGKHPTHSRPKQTAPASFRFDGVLVQLRQKRELLTRAIDALEALGKW